MEPEELFSNRLFRATSVWKGECLYNKRRLELLIKCELKTEIEYNFTRGYVIEDL